MSVVRKLKDQKSALLDVDGVEISLPIVEGSSGERAIDISLLRSQTGLVTIDAGFVNTASCQSKITFLDGEKGVLHYRGYPIEQLAEGRDFIEVSHLLIFGEWPNQLERSQFESEISGFNELPDHICKAISQFSPTAHPMAVLSSVLVSYGAYYERYLHQDPDIKLRREMFARLLSDTKNILGYFYRHSIGKKPVPSKFGENSYSSDFLHQLMGKPPSQEYVKALNVLLILHADHEQNCSTSTVRLVGSSKANLFSCVASGISALWGPLHGGANQAVIEMLESIHAGGGDYKAFLSRAKNKSDSFRLMGFGHRVYKNFDPRARIIKKACDDVLGVLGIQDPLLDIAKGLEEEALGDDYFVSRKLYPNVDFYSGIIYKALGIPTNMFTAMFVLGRLPGWLAQWHELRDDPEFRIGRPRQIYQGPKQRD